MRTERRKMMASAQFLFDYERLSYIENNSNATIDTGVTATQDTKVEMDFKANENKINYTFLHGRNIFYIGSGNANTINYVLLGNVNISSSCNYDKSIRHTYVIGCKYGFSVDGVMMHGKVDGTFTGTKTLVCVQGYKCMLYGLKVSEGNKLIRDYIPCKRKSDGVIGMYDLVGRKFYTSPNGVAFSGGVNHRAKIVSLFEPVAERRAA